ncbi:PepSY domain-containing protein [Dyella flagellata]|uniref:PepSY domain-containing protein n=1 Tax=Dyella flagellata TaxID=1867833 RepID=A0ABQ5XHU2_9GAMM|nr:hypothetical protein [Dyella flagellata]GLQ90623.1 hypothetical protein GCM10007898_41990 [Dyella flagellata]
MALKQLAWMAAAGLLAAGTAAAQSAPPQGGMSLDQAVTQVQQRVGGKVLSAEPRHIGRKVEYRIKVLTPEGHVRVIAVPSDATHVPPAAQSSSKKPPNGGSKKEKH